MPVLVNGKQHLLFIHVPKTAGTSMEILFQKSGWGVGYVDYGLQGTLNHLRPCSPQHMHAEMLQQQFVLHQFSGIFMIVRHPYARFRSEYCFANQNNLDTSAAAVEAWTRKVMSVYAANPHILDNHIRPQHEFYVPGATVYKLEDGFDSMKADLSATYGVQFTSEDVREMTREKQHGFSSSDVVLNDNVKAMLDVFYAEDFIKFGYQRS
ncbi:hypothetical protein GCM10011369_35570 [Neiella marina]|uniref:Sulfotransferase family protein n=1 Tax=Neiella marina TaxID=508461 RepID=A0A8J2UAF9_9GAMM|nr:sulfotransferase family 2 domain-containing protein [Neiella marina]GGA90311.1 hypothetical protein GCM10011369_35570 [Neiella marina]